MELSTRSGARPTYRTTATVVGVIYLVGMVVGVVGNILIQSILMAPDHLAAVSASSLVLGFGALLWLMTVAGDAAHGILMFPVLKAHGERIAVGYLGARIMDAAFIAVMVIFLLLQVPLGSEYLKAGGSDASFLQALSAVSIQASQYAYQVGMSTLGIAGVLLCYTLYRARLIPRPFAIWGLLGYAVIFGGMVSEFMGSGLGLVSSLPGGLWELFIGVWLIAKGFSSAPAVSELTTGPSIAPVSSVAGATA